MPDFTVAICHAIEDQKIAEQKRKERIIAEYKQKERSERIYNNVESALSTLAFAMVLVVAGLAIYIMDLIPRTFPMQVVFAMIFIVVNPFSVYRNRLNEHNLRYFLNGRPEPRLTFVIYGGVEWISKLLRYVGGLSVAEYVFPRGWRDVSNLVLLGLLLVYVLYLCKWDAILAVVLGLFCAKLLVYLNSIDFYLVKVVFQGLCAVLAGISAVQAGIYAALACCVGAVRFVFQVVLVTLAELSGPFEPVVLAAGVYMEKAFLISLGHGLGIFGLFYYELVVLPTNVLGSLTESLYLLVEPLSLLAESFYLSIEPLIPSAETMGIMVCGCSILLRLEL